MRKKLALIFLFVSSALFSQPMHDQLIFSHPLTHSQSDQAQIVNNAGSYIPATGWKAVTESSQLQIILNQALPFEGTMKISVTNFDPVSQNMPETKQHIINMYSRIYTNNKDIFATDGSWWNVRTGVAYSTGEGMAGFKFLAAPRGVDTRDEIRCIENATWDLSRTYEFQVTWTTAKIYCLFENQLMATFNFASQVEPFKYILIGKDNLIYGYSAQPGPVYSNVRIYGAGSLNPVDQSPPQIESVTAISSQKVNIKFNEAIDTLTAENIQNYSSPNIAIQTATISEDLKSVELATTIHSPGQEYQLSISNIADTSAQRNVMSDTTVAYMYTDEMLITNISRANYRFAQRQVGDSSYVDRDYKITAVPEVYEDFNWLLTANDDKLQTNYPFLFFDSNKDISIVIGYDSRLTQIPSWLQDWTLTDVTISTQDSNFKCFAKAYPAGRISLGANHGTGSCSMYLVLLKNNMQTGVVDRIPPDPPTGVRIVER